jgi:hypothetical protein
MGVNGGATEVKEFERGSVIVAYVGVEVGVWGSEGGCVGEGGAVLCWLSELVCVRDEGEEGGLRDVGGCGTMVEGEVRLRRERVFWEGREGEGAETSWTEGGPIGGMGVNGGATEVKTL